MPSGRKKGGRDAYGTLADLWRLLQSVIDDSESTFEALGISVKAYFLLDAVEQHPFPAELAGKLLLPRPTVTYLINQLEAGGFLERRVEAGDLRKFRLVRTPAGVKALRRVEEAMGRSFGERLGRLSADEAATFDRIVGVLTRPGGRDA